MSTDPRTVKAYDEFASRWVQYGDWADKPAHIFLEKPVMRQLAQQYIQWARVLCVWCGTWEECDKLLKLWAREVVGIDISPGMIWLAQQRFPTIEFCVHDIQNPLHFWKFDLVYSSLTMHYLANRSQALSHIADSLLQWGHFVFSAHHPIRRWSQKIVDTNTSQTAMWYTRSATWTIVYGNYLDTQKLEYRLPDDILIQYYNRPISSLISDVRHSPFEIVDFVEPKPDEEAKKTHPEFYDIYSKIPIFLMFDLMLK